MTTAFVTGAGSGIGAAVALMAARQGASVALVDVNPASLNDVAARATAAGAAHVCPLHADIRSEEEVAAAFRRCREELGPPTAVLANAGIEVSAEAHAFSLVDWQRTIEVNLTGAFLTAKHAISEMLRAGVGGSLVLTSSPAAFVGFAGGRNAAYAASKGGISAMLRSLALDYARAGIRVNGVVPGATDTPLLTVNVPPEERSRIRDHIIEAAREQIPLGRLAMPEEVASAVLWLWSDEASYVTGSHLTVDGGLLAKGANDF